MKIAQIILEYLKVILSPQVVVGALACVFLQLFREDIKALLLRIAKIKFPGGAEVSTLQSAQQIKEAAVENSPRPAPEVSAPGFPADLTPQQREAVDSILRAEKATSYLWEYRYLNFFLVHRTQMVLDWLIGLKQPTMYRYFDATWLPIIPSANERAAIIAALDTHHLIHFKDEVIQVTPKGDEYQRWRGPLLRVPPMIDSSERS